MNAPAREASPQKNLQADVCVVGAGYAGLTAALRLQQAHKSVVVLEARDRIGGRVWSVPLSDGTALVDIGGHWVGPRQPYITKLAQEMGVKTFKSYQATEEGEEEADILLVDNQGVTKRFPAGFLDTQPFGLVELGAAFAALDEMASQVPTTAPWEAAKAREWDSQTFATWVDTNVDDPFARDVLRATLAVFLPSDAAEISLLHVLFIIHAVGGLEGLMLGGQDSGLGKGGAQVVVDKIYDVLRPAVHLNAPVHQIAQDDSGVDVISDTVRVRADQVIVTIPPTLTGYIRYHPQLPAARAQVIQRMPMGSVIKATLVYDEAFWRHDTSWLREELEEELSGKPRGLNGTSIATNSPVVGTADGGLDKKHDRPGLLIAFVGGSQARALGRLDPAARQEIIVKEVAARFGPKAAKLSQQIVYPPTGLPYVDHDWAAEEWTRGDYSTYLPPGVLTGFQDVIWERFDRIHWAGTETATEHPGYIDGAVQSGERAAADVLAQIGSHPKPPR